MADGKKSFLLYADTWHTIKKLPDEKAGMLFKTIMRYVNDEELSIDDIVVEIAFEPIKQQLKRDLKHWETIKGKRSDAGKISADKKKQNQHMLTHVESFKQTSTNSTVSDNVSVSVSVNDNVSESVIKKENTHVLFPNLKHSNDQFFIDMENGDKINQIGIITGLELEQLKILLTEFKSNCRLEYPNYNEFADHFKNWVQKKEKEKNSAKKESKNYGKTTNNSTINIPQGRSFGNLQGD